MNNTTNCPGDELLMDAALARAAGAALSDEQRRTSEHASTCSACLESMTFWTESARPVAGEKSGASGRGCLDENEIAEYFDGVMPWEDRTETEAHLSHCTICLHQLSELHTLVVSQRPPRSVPQLALGWLRDGLRIVGEVAEAFTTVPLTAAPVLDAPGGPKALAWDLESANGPIRVTVEHDRGAKASLRLAFQDGAVALGRCRVHLRSGGQLLESRTLDAGGVVEFSELDAVGYDVEIEMIGDIVGFGFSLDHLEN